MLEKVHIDIIGPIPTKSVGGSEYAYTFVDGYTLAVCCGSSRRLQMPSSRFGRQRISQGSGYVQL